MIEGKEIVGLSACFVIGIIVGNIVSDRLLCIISPMILYIFTSFVFFATIFALTCGLYYKRFIYRTILISFFLTGLFISFSDFLIIDYNDNIISVWADNIGGKIKETISEMNLNQDEDKALVKALLMGDKGDLKKETINYFTKSGAAHILALSGMHLGIIYMLMKIVTSVFGKSPLGNIIRTSLIILFSICYTLITGSSPSLVRALIFIIIYESANLFDRKTSPIRVYVSAMMMQLIFNPRMIESTSFQLSYSAVLGIIFIYPKIRDLYKPDEGRFSKFDPVFYIWNVSSLSLSCQVTTLPFSLYYFGYFPKYFLITNLLALPVSTALIISGFLATILSLSGICPDFILKATSFFSELLREILGTIATMP